MPLSDFTWNLQTQQPFIHEVYPKKRKAPGFGDADGEVQSQNDNGEEMENNVWKRRCMEASGDGVMAEVNHNMSTSENLNIPSVQHSHPQGCWPVNPPSNGMFINPLVMTTAMQDDDECVPVNMSSSQQENFSSQQSTHDMQHHQQPFNDDCMIMNLNEETFSRTSSNIIEEQMAYSSMDSDGVPDPEQYKLNMCSSNCLEGERNQPSSKVKCYCRPSWEGIMEMRPYISDYY